MSSVEKFMLPTTKQSVVQQIDEVQKELAQLNQSTHPEYIELLEQLESTRGELLQLAEDQHQLALHRAQRVHEFQSQQIENDVWAAKLDAREKVVADLREERRQLKELLEKLEQRGVKCSDEKAALEAIQLPLEKKEKTQ